MKPHPHGPSWASARPASSPPKLGSINNGDLDMAERMIEAAAAAGADAVKFQNYRTEDFVTTRACSWNTAPLAKTCPSRSTTCSKRCELDREGLARLARCCTDHGVLFFSTPRPAGRRWTT
jgi:sialic acid synthase SpsE